MKMLTNMFRLFIEKKSSQPWNPHNLKKSMQNKTNSKRGDAYKMRDQQSSWEL